MRKLALSFSAVIVFAGLCSASDWNQWRGPGRDGSADDSPKLISQLPKEGLQPLWLAGPIPSAGNGGWGSPVVADGKVYVYAHVRTKKKDAANFERKYPWLPPEKRGHLTDEQYEEYERNRRDEDFQIAISGYDFTETLYCFDLHDGRQLWSTTIDSVYSRFLQSGTPAVIDGQLLVLGAGRVARSFDASTGKELWNTRLPGEFRDEFMMSSIAVAKGVAVVLCGHLFGLEAATGKVLWEADAKSTRGTDSSPVVWKASDEAEYVLCNVAGKDTVCIDPVTGNEVWRVESQAGVSTPVVIGDKMITYGRSRKDGIRCFALSEEGAEMLWVNNTLSDKGSSPVVVAGSVFAQGERRLACIDLQSGKTKWRTMLDLDQPQYTSLVAADDKVFYAHDGVLCFEANAQSYRSLFEAKIDESGLLASEELLKQKLGILELENSEDGRRKAADLYQRKVSRQGPLACSSPAVAGGKLILRRPSGLVCYDLTTSTALSRKDP